MTEAEPCRQERERRPRVTGYILRRIGWALAVLLALAVTTFVLAYVVPADPAGVIAGASASARMSSASVTHWGWTNRCSCSSGSISGG